ncbi:hypothetical protein, partial [Desertihabitans aurantiacus]|uniref:hypothetical protein n=1 Tax=Desertihabitans aurantiacus TaxID=2282477 RepID=UPI0018E4FB2B
APVGAPAGDAVAVARPPVGWLAAALGVAVVAVLLVLGVARPVPAVPLGGWLLAGPVAVSLLALYTRRDVLARTRPVYAAPGWVRPAYVVVSVLVVLAVAVTAWRLADWVGRL